MPQHLSTRFASRVAPRTSARVAACISSRISARISVHLAAAAVVTLGLLFATASTNPLMAQDADEEAIKAALVEMWDALEHGDLDRYAVHLHDDFTAFGETDTYLAEGKAYELRSMADWLNRSSGVHTEMHQPEVTVRGDTAWITYYWTDAGIGADGSRFTSRGKSTRIFVKEGGRWLCIHGHYTLVD